MKAFKVISLAILLAVIPIKSASAAVGLLIWNPGLALGGLASYVTFGLARVVAEEHSDGRRSIFSYLSLAGLIMLDSDTNSVQFTALDVTKAIELNVSESEIMVYNSELEEVNLVFSEIVSALDKNSTLEDSRELWNEASNFIAPETFKVLKAIASHK